MWLAVIVEAFNPKVMPLESAKVKAERLFEVVPALKFILEISPAVEGTE